VKPKIVAIIAGLCVSTAFAAPRSKASRCSLTAQVPGDKPPEVESR